MARTQTTATARKPKGPPPIVVETAAGGPPGSYKLVALADIYIDPEFNVRNVEPETFEKGLKELALDIKVNGLQNPIILERAGDKLVLRGGHRRVAASKLANAELGADIQALPAIIRTDMTERDRLRTMAADQFSSPLGPLALAELAKRLMDTGMSQTEVAQEFQISVAYAGDLKRLADAPEEIKEAVREDIISATLATKLVKEEGAEGAVKLLEAAKEEAGITDATPAGDADVPKQRNQRRSVTQGTVDRARSRSTGGTTTRTPPPEQVDAEDGKGTVTAAPGMSPLKLVSRFVDVADRILATHKRGEPIGPQLSDLAWLLREAAINDYASQGFSGIGKDTPDDVIASFDTGS
jgi:ParB/RepB/Spo0J family partition protein